MLAHELTYLITHFADVFSTAAFEADKPNYLRVLTRQLAEYGLWPLNLRENRLSSLLETLTWFKPPVIEADTYTTERYTAPEPTPHRSPSYGWGAGFTWNDEPPLSPFPSAANTTPTKPPTSANVVAIKTQVEGLCVGICLDCLKGR